MKATLKEYCKYFCIAAAIIALAIAIDVPAVHFWKEHQDSTAKTKVLAVLEEVAQENMSDQATAQNLMFFANIQSEDELVDLIKLKLDALWGSHWHTGTQFYGLDDDASLKQFLQKRVDVHLAIQEYYYQLRLNANGAPSMVPRYQPEYYVDYIDDNGWAGTGYGGVDTPTPVSEPASIIDADGQVRSVGPAD